MAGGALVALCLMACTRTNPAYHRVVAGDGDAEPLPPDAGAPAPEPDTAPVVEAAPDTAPPEVDALPFAPDRATSPDSMDLLARDLAPDGYVPPAGCGLATTDVSAIKNVDGLAIDDDGTIYLLTDDSTHSYVGRLKPNQPYDQKWRRLDNSPVTWGIALDRKNRRIYVLLVGPPGALVVFDDIDGAATGSQVVTDLENPNDAVVGEDGSVYVSNQGDRTVYRVQRAGLKSPISTTPFGDKAMGQMPSALTIDPAGNLIVGLEPGGPIYRVALSADGMQTSRTAIPGWNGWANGLTYDRSGRLYIGIYHDTQPRNLVRLEPDGRVTTIAMNGRFSSIAFGRGPLDCRDLYVTDPYAAMRRVRVMDAF
jgi:sugar lactone lactonase YvrE